MRGWTQNAIGALLLAVFAFPSPVLAKGIFAPYILHPVRRKITGEQTAKANQMFAALGASRSDLEATAHDGALLRGWKVSAAPPNGDWVLLFHGRSQNRLSMMEYAKFLLNSGYGVVMM